MTDAQHLSHKTARRVLREFDIDDPELVAFLAALLQSGPAPQEEVQALCISSDAEKPNREEEKEESSPRKRRKGKSKNKSKSNNKQKNESKSKTRNKNKTSQSKDVSPYFEPSAAKWQVDNNNDWSSMHGTTLFIQRTTVFAVTGQKDDDISDDQKKASLIKDEKQDVKTEHNKEESPERESEPGSDPKLEPESDPKSDQKPERESEPNPEPDSEPESPEPKPVTKSPLRLRLTIRDTPQPTKPPPPPPPPPPATAPKPEIKRERLTHIVLQTERPTSPISISSDETSVSSPPSPLPVFTVSPAVSASNSPNKTGLYDASMTTPSPRRRTTSYYFTPPSKRKHDDGEDDEGDKDKEDSEESEKNKEGKTRQTQQTNQSNQSNHSRPPRGSVSRLPFAPLTAPQFGLVQEQLVDEPFWLLVALVFLTRVVGTLSLPVFWDLKKRYPTPAALAAAADPETNPVEADAIEAAMRHLGLARVRRIAILRYARRWMAQPPRAGVRTAVRNYDGGGSGQSNHPDHPDRQSCWEIGHLTQGAYAVDAWRIFCRDRLLGIDSDDTENFNDSDSDSPQIQPEWMRVLPQDKELRAYLRWRWMREGWEWDPHTGERQVLREAMRRAVNEGRVGYDAQGELQILEEESSSRI